MGNENDAAGEVGGTQHSLMYDHEQLAIWRRSHALTIAIHRVIRGRVRGVPAGLATQLSRSISGVPATIAESGGQSTPGQAVRFIDMAIGSLSETQNHLALASATGLISADDAAVFIAETRELRKMTFAFRKWLLRG